MTDQPLFAGKYQLVRQLAAGGMGSVWEAVQQDLGRRVALKRIHPSAAADHVSLQRFLREGVALAQLDHPHAVRVYDVGTDGPSPYLAMEFIDGVSLETFLQENGPLPPEAVVTVADQVLQVLEVAHPLGIVHRDLKPANLMLTRRQPLEVRVVDFGIAAVAPDGLKLTLPGEVGGTPHYMSPEQIRAEPATPASDLYSLGCTLFELLSGAPPFDFKAAVEVLGAHLHREPPALTGAGGRAVPPGLEAVVRQALAKRPEQRFPSATAMRLALAGALASEARGAARRPLPLASSPSSSEEALVGLVDRRARRDFAVELALASSRLSPVALNPATAIEFPAYLVMADGPEATFAEGAKLLAVRPGARVVLVCPVPDFAFLHRALTAGFFGVVPVPLDAEELVRTVSRAARPRGGRR